MRVIVTGGGTGGHITPLKPILSSLPNNSTHSTMFIGQRRDRFADLIESESEVDQKRLIFSGKYRRYPNQSLVQRAFDLKTHILNARDIVLIGAGFVQSVFILRKFKPDVVFGKGGYVSVPVGLAARVLGVPLVIHESDALPGLANKILSSSARVVALGMPMEGGFKDATTKFTGIPLRQEFIDFAEKKPSKNTLKKKLGLKEDKPLLVVTGGSLGAGRINDQLVSSIGALEQTFQIVHITGQGNYDEVVQSVGDLKSHPDYQAVAFSSDIHSLFAASDIVVSRASATFFAELAMLGVASVLIPASQLGDQKHNAALAESKDAALVLHEEDMLKNKSLFSGSILKLHSDEARMKMFKKNISQFASKNAAQDIIDLLEEAAKNA